MKGERKERTNKIIEITRKKHTSSIKARNKERDERREEK